MHGSWRVEYGTMRPRDLVRSRLKPLARHRFGKRKNVTLLVPVTVNATGVPRKGIHGFRYRSGGTGHRRRDSSRRVDARFSGISLGAEKAPFFAGYFN